MLLNSPIFMFDVNGNVAWTRYAKLEPEFCFLLSASVGSYTCIYWMLNVVSLT